MAGYTKPRSIQDAVNFGGVKRDTDTTRANGLEDILEELSLMSGRCAVFSINDCETAADWTESDDGTLDIAKTTGGGEYRTGSGAMKITNTAATDASQYVETKYVNGSVIPAPFSPDHNDDGSVDLRDYDYVGGWLYGYATAEFGTAGELQFALVNDGTVQTLHNMPAAGETVHQRFEIDVSGDTRDKVTAIRFYAENTNTGEDCNVDAIVAYKHGNGHGPVMGQCIYVPIESGQTLTKGQIVQVNVASIFGTPSVQVEGAAACNSGGVVVVGGTGNAQGTVFAVVQIGGYAYMRAGTSHGIGAGEYAGWASATTIAGEGAANPEFAICKALEAPGADADEILVLITQDAVVA